MTRLPILIGLGLIALGLVGYGAWLAWPPAGPIAAGLMMWISLERVK